ncbi:unnamed protein product [Acanthoscelides obtectus]|uniref:Uncharacterized protein n=1 Tax=Acanthoscelides obtectus TaxID=200917 RepID=A0A9P0JX31_ACAOB|nr:unnamed protein product [Acanthoscelides obtectus]CAK1632090.1 hypothetical protein AOBTE_LOCUS7357 [Acanthoscelides obtectus]
MTLTPFNTQDKTCIVQAAMNIQKLLTQVENKVSQLEKENVVLAARIENSQPKCTRTDSSGKSVSTTKEPISKVEEPWTTPPENRKSESIIRVEKTENPRVVLSRLKQEFTQKDTEGGFKNIRQLQSGAVIVESHTASQKQKLKNILKDKNDITIKTSDGIDPMFLITGTEKGYEAKEFIDELIKLNNEIEAELNYSITDKIKVVTKKNCRNPHKENWILQAPPEIAKWFLKRGQINFDLPGFSNINREQIDAVESDTYGSFKHMEEYNRIALLHQNVQSLGNSINEVNQMIANNSDCKFICITEHWKGQDQSINYGIRNFNLASCFYRKQGKHGGSAVYVRVGVQCSKRSDIK